MTAQDFSLLLRLTESDGDPEALGDYVESGPQAITSYQVHPGWVFDQVKRFNLPPLPGESWDAWIARLVAAFFLELYSQDVPPLQIAMHFHKGHPVTPSSPDWDQEYAARFTQFASAHAIALS